VSKTENQKNKFRSYNAAHIPFRATEAGFLKSFFMAFTTNAYILFLINLRKAPLPASSMEDLDDDVDVDELIGDISWTDGKTRLSRDPRRWVPPSLR